MSTNTKYILARLGLVLLGVAAVGVLILLGWL